MSKKVFPKIIIGLILLFLSIGYKFNFYEKINIPLSDNKRTIEVKSAERNEDNLNLRLDIKSDVVKAKYVKKVDGDTAVFEIDKKNIKCRFLAIDTPETVKANTEVQPFGKEASKYTDYILKNAKNIYLEFDKNSDKYDKYDRMLVWVWCDNYLLQEQLIKKGYAKIEYIYGDYKYISVLEKVEEKAKNENLGIWK